MLKVWELRDKFGPFLRSREEFQIPVPPNRKYESFDHLRFMVHGSTMLM